MNIELILTREDERENFIANLQAAFQTAAQEEGGCDIDDEIISREDILATIESAGAQTLNIVRAGEVVGGAVVILRPNNHNELSLFFVDVNHIGEGIGFAAWRAIEARYPQTKIWEASTPYFAKRNLHFYINKCGFHAVEFYNPRHPSLETDDDYFFRFEKVVKP